MFPYGSAEETHVDDPFKVTCIGVGLFGQVVAEVAEM
jgi:hypothetical protein